MIKYVPKNPYKCMLNVNTGPEEEASYPELSLGGVWKGFWTRFNILISIKFDKQIE